MSSLVFVGIDVSQASLDVAVSHGNTWSVPHNESAMTSLVEQLATLHPTLIVFEATGGLELR